jgi:hypothetical protein
LKALRQSLPRFNDLLQTTTRFHLVRKVSVPKVHSTSPNPIFLRKEILNVGGPSRTPDGFTLLMLDLSPDLRDLLEIQTLRKRWSDLIAVLQPFFVVRKLNEVEKAERDRWRRLSIDGGRGCDVVKGRKLR